MRDDPGSERVHRRGHRHPRAGRRADGRLLPLAGRPVRHGAGRDRAAGASSARATASGVAGGSLAGVAPGRLAEAALHAVHRVVAGVREIVRSTASGRSFVRIVPAARGAQRGDVGDRREPEHDGEEEQAHLLGERDDRDDAADRPTRAGSGSRTWRTPARARRRGRRAARGCRTRAARPRRRSRS